MWYDIHCFVWRNQIPEDQMSLSIKQVSQNYQECYRLICRVMESHLGRQGHEADLSRPEIVELCQSVLGHEPVVRLLQQKPFRESVYQSVVQQAVDEVKKMLFPDVAKKRFVSIEAVGEKGWHCETQIEWEDEQLSVSHPERVITYLQEHLSPPSFRYLTEVLIARQKIPLPYGTGSTGHSRSSLSSLPIEQIEQKLKLLRRFYPEGEIRDTSRLNGLEDLTESQVIHAYLNVYLGIERFFPPNFLQKDGENRAALLIRFLIEEILQTHPETVLRQKDETFFIRHKLQNVYRFFNYSANRALRNAYPDLIHPWLGSRCSTQYWEKTEHRAEAIRWLVEDRLGLSPQQLFKANISRDDFARNGLSYMFNQYYNSVSRALGEAYPHLQPWEIGKVPFDFWTDERAAQAIRWMIARKGWQMAELPEKVRRKEFTRKTFTEFGLATLFEKKFSRNFYRVISAAYPGEFYPWEFGKIASQYWETPSHVFEASRWIAEQEGIPEEQIPPAIRQKRLGNHIFRKYSIGTALKKWCGGKIEQMFAPWLWREHQFFLREHKLLRKIKTLKKQQKADHLLYYLLYGFFFYDVQLNNRETDMRYERIANRIQRRSVSYEN